MSRMVKCILKAEWMGNCTLTQVPAKWFEVLYQIIVAQTQTSTYVLHRTFIHKYTKLKRANNILNTKLC